MRIPNNGPLEGETQVCPRCKGTGFTDQYDEDVCLTCLGEGEVPVLQVTRKTP